MVDGRYRELCYNFFESAVAPSTLDIPGTATAAADPMMNRMLGAYVCLNDLYRMIDAYRLDRSRDRDRLRRSLFRSL